jgi:hypothetical protein
MAGGFKRSRTGRIVLRVEEGERGLLRSLAAQVLEFVTPDDSGEGRDPLAILIGIDPEASAPQDPALARLLPDAYAGDGEASGDFRRFTERSLRETKMAHAQLVLDTLERSGDKITLSAEEATSWLGFLNDARLALGTRIAITEENHEELASLPEDDPRAGLFGVYDWLTYLQESLLQAHFLKGL